MAGGGKGLLLRTGLVLCFFAVMGAAGRPQPSSQSSAAGGLARALGMAAGTSQGCCNVCICPLIWPPEAGFCLCSGSFESCPDFCDGDCICVEHSCSCAKPVSYKTCKANQCDLAAADATAARAAEK